MVVKVILEEKEFGYDTPYRREVSFEELVRLYPAYEERFKFARELAEKSGSVHAVEIFHLGEAWAHAEFVPEK